MNLKQYPILFAEAVLPGYSTRQTVELMVDYSRCYDDLEFFDEDIKRLMPLILGDCESESLQSAEVGSILHGMSTEAHYACVGIADLAEFREYPYGELSVLIWLSSLC